MSLRELVAPGRAALVTQECQNGVVGERAIFPQLADAARDVVPNIVRIATAARASGVPVVHCLALRRPDGLGSNANARLFGAAAKAPVKLLPGSVEAQLVPALGPEQGDVVLTRFHGLGPFWGTDLDPVLRNLGVRTVVAVGVSVNVGMTNLVMDAVNAGYHVVLPRDATAGVPPEYADAVIDNTLSLLATLTTADEIVEAWLDAAATPEGEG